MTACVPTLLIGNQVDMEQFMSEIDDSLTIIAFELASVDFQQRAKRLQIFKTLMKKWITILGNIDNEQIIKAENDVFAELYRRIEAFERQRPGTNGDTPTPMVNSRQF